MMRENIRLLEDRVAKTAKRLKRLSDEKATLNREVTTLRNRLAATEGGESPEGISDTRFASERSSMASRLREALDLLQED